MGGGGGGGVGWGSEHGGGGGGAFFLWCLWWFVPYIALQHLSVRFTGDVVCVRAAVLACVGVERVCGFGGGGVC